MAPLEEDTPMASRSSRLVQDGRIRALILNTAPSRYPHIDEQPRISVTATVVTLNETGPDLDIKNATYWSNQRAEDAPGGIPEHWLDKFEVSCDVYRYTPGKESWRNRERSSNWEIGYRNAYGLIKPGDARVYAKVLTKLESALQKARDQGAYPQTFGGYLALVARTLGCSAILLRPSSCAADSSYSASYDRDTVGWRRRSLGDAVWTVDNYLEDWRNPRLDSGERAAS